MAWDLVKAQRVFRVKKAVLRFFCPLCGAQRGLRYGRLRLPHYLRILVISMILAVVLWPFCGAKSLSLGLLVWAGYEFALGVLGRQEVPCPHCGLDAIWYRRDVNTARKMVQGFWAKSSLPVAKKE